MSEVRGRSREDPMPEGRQPRGVTPRPRSGAAAESARLRRCRNGREELLKSGVRSSGREDYPASEVRGGGAVAWRSYPMPLCKRPGAVARRTNPTSKERWLRGHKRA